MKPVTIKWSGWWNAPRLLPWVALLGLLLLPANRNRRAWMMLVPLALVQGAALLIMSIPLAQSATSILAFLISSYPAGLAGLLLVLPYLTIRNRWVSFFHGLIVMGLMGVAECIGTNGTLFVPGGQTLYIFYGLGSLVLILGLLLGGRACRKGFSGGRFLRLLLSWLIIVACVAMMGCMALVLVSMTLAFRGSSGISPGQQGLMLLGGLVYGLVLGCMLFLTVLPVLILALRSGLYRARLMGLLYPATGGRPEGEMVQEAERIRQDSQKEGEAAVCGGGAALDALPEQLPKTDDYVQTPEKGEDGTL